MDFLGQCNAKRTIFIFEKSNFANIILFIVTFFYKDHILLSLTPFENVPPAAPDMAYEFTLDKIYRQWKSKYAIEYWNNESINKSTESTWRLANVFNNESFFLYHFFEYREIAVQLFD